MEPERKGSPVFAQSPRYPLDCKPGCRYRAADGGCSYIFIAGKMRGCEPGKDCTRYQSRRAPRKKDEITLGGPDKRNHKKAPWDVQRGYDLWQQGMSMAGVARDLGITVGAVQWRKQHYWVFGRA